MALTWDQISAVTEKKFVPKLVDNIFDEIPLFAELEDKIKKLDGGTHVMQPLLYATASNVEWYSGADTLATADTEQITAAQFSWAQIHVPIAISRRDELLNSGDSQKVNFVKAKMQAAEKSLKNQLGSDVYNAGTNAKAIAGLRCFVTTSQTYGGISQSTYSWWQSNVDSTSTTMTLAVLDAQYSAIEVSGGKPKIGVTTSANLQRYNALLQPQQRFAESKRADAGFQNLLYKGCPVMKDGSAPASSWYFLDTDYLDLYVHKDENFRMEPFMKPINQNVRVAHIHAMLCMASSNNRMHAGLTALAA